MRLNGRGRFLLLIPLALSLFVLVKMSVMAGFTGVIGGGVLSLPVVLPVDKTKRKCLAFGVLALVIVSVCVLFLVDIGSGALHEAHEILHGNWSEEFGSGRIHIWKAVLEQIPSHFILGAGPDTMLNAELEAFTRYDEAAGAMFVAQIDTAHNEYLNILYHQGILALIAYLALLVSLAKAWIQRSEADGVAAMLGCGALCYCVQAFFGISTCMTAPFFWITLGLLDGRRRKK
jgi:O-antigen ligase